MVFYWSMSVSMSLHVSRTLLSILADHNNELVQIVSVLHQISCKPVFFFFFLAFCDCSKCTNYKLESHLPNFFFFTQIQMFIFLLFYFLFILCCISKVHEMTSSFFLINIRPSLLAGIKWSICISKFKMILCLLL